MASALLMDLYELTMVDAYLAEGLHDEAAFSLFVRRLPARRNLLLACGLEDALVYLETLRFSPEELAWLESLGSFSPRLLEWLEHFRFTGDVHAMPEGTPVFGEEPLLEVVAPLPQAQLVETAVMNQVHLQTLAASKAVRVVEAARGRPVVDFGVRRMHGEDAGLKVARAGYIAGVDSTSNLEAGRRYGIPVAGTMAHSYIQAHDDELAAFRAYVRRFPETTLLVDTYDTLEGVRKVIALARELGPDFRVRAVRLDSGDLVSLSHSARWLLDAAGLEHVRIFASGGLDEDQVEMLLAHHAPIDAFGVGTAMGVSADAPALDMAYKLVEYAGHERLKLSTGKVLLPGRKCGSTHPHPEPLLPHPPRVQENRHRALGGAEAPSPGSLTPLLSSSSEAPETKGLVRREGCPTRREESVRQRSPGRRRPEKRRRLRVHHRSGA